MVIKKMFFAMDQRKSSSSASTDETESDWEATFPLGKPVYSLVTPTEHYRLFTLISEEQKSSYRKLSSTLPAVYAAIEKESEPVCVRDLKAVAPKIIELNSIFTSSLSKRRVVAVKQA